MCGLTIKKSRPRYKREKKGEAVREVEKETAVAKRKGMSSAKKACSPPSPPPLLPPPQPRPRTTCVTPRPRKAAAMVKSVTRDEIDMFWRRKKMEEEDHLLAAQKAAARIRAKALKEEDYKRFEESLREAMDCDEDGEEGKEARGGDNKKELRIGIKDWWTKSKYAYLNQPSIKSMGENAALKKATSTYIPQKNCLSYYSPATHQVFPTSSFHVF